MPSLDTIRTITIKGQADGVDQTTTALKNLTDAIKAANDNLAKGNAVAQDNAAGWSITGEGAASAANHLRQAAEAAYAFSPAFRSVVNEMAVPALKVAGTALEGVAAGIVTATNVAGTGLISLAAAAEKVNPNFLGLTSSVRGAGIALEAFSPTLGGAAASLGSIALRFVPVLGQILLVYDTVKLTAAAWELATQRLKDYNDISNNAIGLSTDFYQRTTKAAESAKLPVEDLTAALKKMNDALTPQLGGADGIKRLDELTKAGNFSGNSGVAQLKGAIGTQDQLAAMVNLIKQAGDQSERLAAIDLAKTVFGTAISDNLSKDYDYLSKIKSTADSIAGASIISDADVSRAVQIQARFDAAYKTLSDRWHPLQDVLTDLGQRFQLEWLSFLEAVAGVANAFEKAYNWAARLAALSFDGIKQGLRGAAGLQGSQFGPLDDAAGSEQSRAIDRLRSGLAQPNQINRGGADLSAIYSSIRGDKSKDPAAKDTGADTSAYDRATESVLKYIEVTKAASLTVGDGAAEQEKFKINAQLTAAAMKDGLTPEAAKAKAEMSGLGEKAGVAAEALAKAKIAGDIKFNSKTSLLSADDVQIATQLKTIYPDVATALNSVEASAIRTNTATKGLASALETNLTSGLTDIAAGTKSASQGFRDMGLAIVKAIDEMIIKMLIVQPLMRSLGLTSLGGLGGSLGGAGITYGTAGTAGSNLFGPIAPTTVGMHSGGIVGSEATFNRFVHPAYFDHASRFHTGGIAGDEVPIIAKKGEGVFTQGQMAAMGGGGGGGSNVTHIYNIDASGADSGTVKQIQSVLAKHAQVIGAQGKAMKSAQRFQSTGVG